MRKSDLENEQSCSDRKDAVAEGRAALAVFEARLGSQRPLFRSSMHELDITILKS
jgi:hypothetical protein